MRSSVIGHSCGVSMWQLNATSYCFYIVPHLPHIFHIRLLFRHIFWVTLNFGTVFTGTFCNSRQIFPAYFPTQMFSTSVEDSSNALFFTLLQLL